MVLTRARRVAAILLGLGTLGCDELLTSKETRQRIEAVKAAVTENPERVDAPDENGQPPLHNAVVDGYLSLQTWLLDHRADPNARNARGETPLHLAVLSDRTPDRQVIRALIRRGADPNAGREDGSTPLHVAAAFGTEASVRVLLENGADPRRRSHRGDTPLHGAATPQPDRTAEDSRRIIERLIARGADPNATNGSAMAPLHQAAMAGHVVVIQSLLDAGAHVDLEGPGRATALSLAATMGNAPAVSSLLARGADPGHRDGAGLTPLEAALANPAIRYGDGVTGPVNVDAVVNVLRRPERTSQPIH